MTDDEVPIAPWTVTGTRTLIDDRWISVRADDCVTEEGHVIAPYYVVEVPDWVQVIAIDDDGFVLLVEQYRHGRGVISLEVPAGTIDPGDDDVLAAGERELIEETGYGAREWRLVATMTADPSRQTNDSHVILALGAHQVRAPDDDPTERIRLRRVPIATIGQLIFSGRIRNSGHIAGLALALASIGRWQS